MASPASSKGNAEDPKLAWFWHIESASLFVGHAGGVYPECHELTPCINRGWDAACDVFMQYINPYKDTVIPPHTVSTFYLDIQLPP